MTNQPEPARLLRDVERYLSALHGSVARHDNLAADYGCAGCELRDRIAAAIWERQNPGRRWADCEYRWRADAEADADAVLSVLPASADRATVLREAADRIDREDLPQDQVDMFDNGARWATSLLRRMAAESVPAVAGRTETQAHVGGNAEDCPACHGTNPDYPFICPGPDATEAHQPDSETPGSRHAPGAAILCPGCRAKGHSVCMSGEGASETVHGCPPDGSGLTPCCGRTPFELPLTDRISSEAPVTCPGPAGGAQQPKETRP